MGIEYQIQVAPPGPGCLVCAKALRANYEVESGRFPGEWMPIRNRANMGGFASLPWVEIHADGKRYRNRIGQRKTVRRIWKGTYGHRGDGRFCDEHCGYGWAIRATDTRPV